MNMADFKTPLIFKDSYEVGEFLEKQLRAAEAWEATATRLDDFHKYVEKYCLQEGLGKNVFHTVLDDAIKLRKLLFEQ